MALGGDQSLSIVIKARDEASAVFNKVQENAGKLSSRLENAADASRTFALGLTAGAVAIGGLGYAALKAAGDMEQTKIAFETMLGSASKADAFIKQLVSFAKTTPFELKGLNQAAKQLLAYGFAQEEVIPNLKALGDIASGVGMDKLPNLILAYGQVRAATKLTGMELRQFTEAGVPLLGMLAEQMGKPVSAIQEMVSAGEIGFPEVEKALKSLTGEGGRFNDLMAKQATSLGGMVSNLSDAWNMFLAGEGAKLLDWAKKFVQIAQFIITDVLPAWINAISALIDFFDRHQVAIYIVAGAIVGALIPAIWAAVTAFAALAVTLAPFIITGAVIGGVVAGIVWIVQNWDMLRAKASAVWGAITSTIRDAFQSVTDFVMDKVQMVIDAYNRMVELVSKPIKMVTNTVSKAASAFGNVFSSLPQFEQGGIVPGAAGVAVPIMAHGQETVIPAGAAASMRGGSNYQVIINNPQVRSRADVDYLRTQIEEALRDVSRGHKLATI